MYGRFLDPQARTTFLEAFKDLEALWEIVSPDPALRDHVATFRRLAQWYAAVRNEYAERIGFVADLAHKTRRLVQASARQEGLGRLAAGVTFDTGTVQTLRETPGSYEAKVFNLVRGLRQEIDTSPDTAPVLRPIRERAERVLTELETRQTSVSVRGTPSYFDELIRGSFRAGGTIDEKGTRVLERPRRGMAV